MHKVEGRAHKSLATNDLDHWMMHKLRTWRHQEAWFPELDQQQFTPQRCRDSFEISQVLDPVVWWKGHEAGKSCAGRMATSVTNMKQNVYPMIHMSLCTYQHLEGYVKNGDVGK